MTAPTHLDLDLVEASGRATLYSYLATGLAFPTETRLGTLGDVLAPALACLDLPRSLDRAVRSSLSNLPSDLERLRVDHTRLFPPIASQDAPSYETAYRGEGIFQQTAVLADIAGFYRAHGLRAGGSEKERLDHIGVELEFMAVAARKRALGLQMGLVEEARICGETSGAFLRDHLGCWGPAFGRRMAAVTDAPWYRELGRLLTLWIVEDMRAQGIVPAETVDEPLPQDPLDDGVCGPCPVPGGGGLR